jgi:hypothetical protein
MICAADEAEDVEFGNGPMLLRDVDVVSRGIRTGQSIWHAGGISSLRDALRRAPIPTVSNLPSFTLHSFVAAPTLVCTNLHAKE